ncbi:hypothetical protein BDD12DRAFT_842213 [Trichophaea hybrida]|nr:hypothetical protein BDD12DRAFT_842213 [Trichophaea hybrida]
MKRFLLASCLCPCTTGRSWHSHASEILLSDGVQGPSACPNNPRVRTLGQKGLSATIRGVIIRLRVQVLVISCIRSTLLGRKVSIGQDIKSKFRNNPLYLSQPISSSWSRSR